MSAADQAAGSRRDAGRGSRRRSRELALQSLYQWLVAGTDVRLLCREALADAEAPRPDETHFVALMEGVVQRRNELDDGLQPFLDRPAESLSPIEHVLLLLGAYELTACLDVPYRVVINEAVELAKSYGGTDGHRYVNGVIVKLAAQVRPHEVRR